MPRISTAAAVIVLTEYMFTPPDHRIWPSGNPGMAKKCLRVEVDPLDSAIEPYQPSGKPHAG
jgi:hypothetical protein